MSRTDDNLQSEMRASFDFFRDAVSTHPDGFGLTRDRAPRYPDFFSIAATGFGLAAHALAVECGWQTRAAAKKKCVKTLETFLHLDNYRGFFRHFYHADGRPYPFEYSTIDTAIFLCGARVAGHYFGGAALELADRLFSAVQWSAFLDGDGIFRMAYDAKRGFFAQWDAYAEQLMLYVLAAAAKATDARPYYTFCRDFGCYKGIRFCYTCTGALFAHQYSHCFIDFRFRRDRLGMDWFENSVRASKAARQFCIDTADVHPTYRSDCWGLTACDTPWGYRGDQGSPPYRPVRPEHGGGFAGRSLGVVAPAAALGSMPFLPDESRGALDYYMSLPNARGAFGLVDAISTERDWYASDVLGIDKGIGLLQAANALDGFVWRYFHDEQIETALERLGICRIGEQ